MADLRSIVAGEKTSSRVEKRYVRKDGTVVWGAVSINLVRNGQGQPLHFMPFILDMTERKMADEALRVEKANLYAVFESSPVAMFVVDETTNIVMTNRAFTVMCGGSESEILQHRPGNALRCVHSHKDPRGCGYSKECKSCNVRNGVEGLIANGGSLHGAELELELTRDEVPGRFWMSIGVEPVIMDGCRRWCIAMDDVTERRRAEEKLRHFNDELEQRVRERTVELDASTRELEAFSYSVSHDLRAPLRAIDGFGHALLEDCEDRLDAGGKDHLKRIRAATQHMGTLIDDMLRLSRITRMEMLVEKVNLTEIAWSIINELRESQPERTVRVEIAKGLEVTADPKLIRIALENLLRNAWKFTGKRSEAVIELGAASEGAKTTYFVRDNGAGFDMAYADKLFTPFQRLHSMEEYPGTGIGLGTVSRIVRRHGGKVWAEGQVDRGATFHFSLQG
jgi:PAS domain S-box-containing protein